MYIHSPSREAWRGRSPSKCDRIARLCRVGFRLIAARFTAVHALVNLPAAGRLPLRGRAHRAHASLCVGRYRASGNITRKLKKVANATFLMPSGIL